MKILATWLLLSGNNTCWLFLFLKFLHAKAISPYVWRRIPGSYYAVIAYENVKIPRLNLVNLPAVVSGTHLEKVILR